MRRTLYRKLILIYVILAIAGFTLISTVGSRMVEDSLVSSASTSLYREATQIASKQGDLYYHSERSLTDLYNSLSALASYHNSQIWLISADGEILLNTAAALDEENPKIIDGFDPVALGSEYYSTGTFFGHFEDKMLSVMVPVTSDFRINGYVAIHLPLQDVYQQRESLLARIDFLFLLVFGLSFVILIFFSLVVYRPLKKIINGAKEYASGNLPHKIDVKSHDEMGYLASTLNYMSGELNKTGEYQRKFVANVSHDFRSPLTSIKGYIKGVKDGVANTPQKQEQYLDIAYQKACAMDVLLRKLSDFSKLETGNMPMEPVATDFGAFLQEMLDDNEQYLREKDVNVIFFVPEEKVITCIDHEQTKRVLRNIMENSMKYRCREQVLIRMNLIPNKESVILKITDDGEGVPEEKLPHLFEQFYRGDETRNSRIDGDGLGLYIAKRIIEQQGGSISASNHGGFCITIILPRVGEEQEQI